MFHIKWTGPKEYLKEIERYQVRYRIHQPAKPTVSWQFAADELNPERSQFELKLESDRFYEVQIGSILKSDGSTQWTESHIAKTGQSGSPYIKSVRAEGNKVRIVWTKPFRVNNVRHYKVRNF